MQAGEWKDERVCATHNGRKNVTRDSFYSYAHRRENNIQKYSAVMSDGVCAIDCFVGQRETADQNGGECESRKKRTSRQRLNAEFGRRN